MSEETEPTLYPSVPTHFLPTHLVEKNLTFGFPSATALFIDLLLVLAPDFC